MDKNQVNWVSIYISSPHKIAIDSLLCAVGEGNYQIQKIYTEDNLCHLYVHLSPDGMEMMKYFTDSIRH
jgi:hypothetical protein